MNPLAVVQALWLGWLMSWLAASVWSAPSVKRAGLGDEMAYRLLSAAGALLLFRVFPAADVAGRWQIHMSAAWAWAMASVTLAGLLFTWWARLHLGRLWSGSITRKENHQIIDTGPYSLVRHPIYTGILIAALATALLRASAFALTGLGMISFGLFLKARLEERFLREQLGAHAYDAYAQRVPMLVPFVRPGLKVWRRRDSSSSLSRSCQPS